MIVRPRTQIEMSMRFFSTGPNAEIAKGDDRGLDRLIFASAKVLRPINAGIVRTYQSSRFRPSPRQLLSEFVETAPTALVLMIPTPI